MSHRKRHPNRLAEERLADLDGLLDQHLITDSEYSVLDAVARVEAGMLDYETILAEFIRK